MSQNGREPKWQRAEAVESQSSREPKRQRAKVVESQSGSKPKRQRVLVSQTYLWYSEALFACSWSSQIHILGGSGTQADLMQSDIQPYLNAQHLYRFQTSKKQSLIVYKFGEYIIYTQVCLFMTISYLNNAFVLYILQQNLGFFLLILSYFKGISLFYQTRNQGLQPFLQICDQ